MDELTQERLKELISYDPETGEVKWLVSTSNRVRTGDVSGTRARGQYVKVMINSVIYAVHRLAFLYMEGSFPPEDVDHINGKKDDNRWCNLRAVSRSENMRNQRLSRRNTSGVIGVYFHIPTGKWMAYINVNKKRTHLGLFVDKDDAAKARRVAESKLGFHPNHGRQA